MRLKGLRSKIIVDNFFDAHNFLLKICFRSRRRVRGIKKIINDYFFILVELKGARKTNYL